MAHAISSPRDQALAALGLPPGAGAGEARRAFRRMAFSCHPDLYPGRPDMAARFHRLAAAYRLARGEETPPGDLLEAGGAGAPARGRDIHFRLGLTFTQAALGAALSVRFRRPLTCPRCGGAPGRRCSRCGGRGEEEAPVVMRIRVPAGVEEGEVFRLRGAGGEAPPGEGAGEGAGQGPGDLYLHAAVRPHATLRRRGLDIHSEVAVAGRVFLSGGTVRVPTLRGLRRLFVLPPVPPGKIFQLPGEGVRRTRGGVSERGDHFVRLIEAGA